MPEARLIDANALHAKIYEDSERNYGASANIAQVLLRIETAPTIKAEPVRHGHWIFREEATPEYLPWDMWCSCCGEYHDSDDYNDRYCSKCGAKMDQTGGTVHDDIVRRDEATEALAEIINAPSINRWISVEDALPEIDIDVIVYYPYWSDKPIQVAHLAYDKLTFELSDGEFNFPTSAVTHWMKLPEPPEKE